jgi:hypothetical protein
MRWWWGPLCTRPTLSWIFIVLAHWNNSLRIDMLPHSDTLARFQANQSLLMVSILATSAVDSELKPWSCQTKDYIIGICCFSAKHASLTRKSKDWLAWNRANVSEWGNMAIRRLLFQWANTIKIQLSVGLVQSGPHHHLTTALVARMLTITPLMQLLCVTIVFV